MNDQGNIGEVLRKWRIMSDLSLKQVAEQIGVKYVTIHNIESGGKMDSDTQLKLIKWLFERGNGNGPKTL